MPRLRLATLACVLTACLVAPAAAHAAITVGEDLSLTPTDSAAGAHTQVDLHASFSTDDALKDLVVHLPPGLVGNPQAVAQCKQAQFDADPSGCPAGSKVGTTTATTTVLPASGDVYNLTPAPGEPARLGASLMNGQIKQLVAVALRPDGGLDTVIRDFPRTDPVLGLPLAVKALDLSLDKRFMTNPSSCGTAKATVEATSYSGAHGARSTGYTTGKCAALPYAPALAATIDAAGPKGKEIKPALTTIITVPAGHSSTRTTTVTLPARVGVDVTALRGAVCTLEQVAADACPESSRVGSVQAQTPLLAAPLTGAVYMAQIPGELLPGLRLALGGPVQLRLNGTLHLGKNIVATFDGIPDVPLARLELTFAAGGPLRVPGGPCTGAALPISAALTGHNGAQVTSATQLRVLNCPIAARVRVSKRKRPALRIGVDRGRDAVALREVRIALPRGLRVAAPGKARASADGHPLARPNLQVSARSITLRLRGARAVTVRLPRGALRGRSRGRFRVTGVRTDGKRSAIRVKATRLR